MPKPFAHRAALAAVAVAVLAPAAWATGRPPGAGGPGASHRAGVVTLIDRLHETSVARAQITESPFTTPAGRWAVEVGVASFAHDALDSLRDQSFEFAPLSLAYGFTRHVDAQLVANPLELERLSVPALGLSSTRAGLGDVAGRLRVCWTGTDSSGVGVGTIVFVSHPAPLPGAASGSAEGGVMLPVSVPLPGEWTLGAMAEGDVRNDALGGGHHAEWVGSGSLAHDLAPRLSGFVELVGVGTAQAGANGLAAADAGVDWDPAPQLSVGAGASVGDSGGHTDAGAFASLSWHR